MGKIISRLLRWDVALGVAILAIIGVVALFPQAEEDSGYPTIASDLEPLRAAFNADPGNVRAVLLASPT
ncbi:MAG: hypothetical protein IH936_11840 [Acidobacteria bacterium]|nr:hypothetical protein [Acidobacteriota bacterium]